jgi:hypothetical protein
MCLILQFTDSLKIKPLKSGKPVGAIIQGSFQIEKGGSYKFCSRSSDGSVVSLQLMLTPMPILSLGSACWTTSNLTVFNTGQLVLSSWYAPKLALHTRLLNPENTHKYTLTSRYGQMLHAAPWWLDECWDMQLHLSFGYWPTHGGSHPAPNTNQQMQLPCQALNACRKMRTLFETLSSRCSPTYKALLINEGTCQILYTRKYMQTHFQLLERANTRRCTLCCWYVQAYAHTCSTLSAWKTRKIYFHCFQLTKN